MTQLTPFGKAVRHLRIERQMMLGDMADALGVSPSYLSQIETGKKPIPPGMVDRTVVLFNLQGDEVTSLRHEAAKSTTEFKISLDADAPARDRIIANELAMEFARLNPDAKDRIQKIVRGEDNAS